jgi:hypothetical protein
MNDDPNDTKIGFEAIKDIGKDAVDRGVISEEAAKAMANNYAKNTESRKIVFRVKANLIKLRKNIIEYWFRYLAGSAALSGGGWSFHDTIIEILK